MYKTKYLYLFSIILLSATEASWANEQLIYLYEGKPVSKQAYDGHQLTRQGMDLIRQGDLDQALEKLSTAVQLVPDSATAENSLGTCYSLLGQKEAAQIHLERAVQLDPFLDVALFNLAGFYYSFGDLNRSRDVYRAFVARFPQSQYTEQARVTLGSLEQQLQAELSRPKSIGQNDYFSRSEGRRHPIWPANHRHLKVYIQTNAPIGGWRPQFPSIVQQAFRTWEAASTNLFRFHFVDSPGLADIICYFTDNPAALAVKGERGETIYHQVGGKIASAKITLLTTSPDSVIPYSNQAYLGIALHEIGHALGIWWHSDSADDIMFPTAGYHKGNRLSVRDINTLRRIYGLAQQNSETIASGEQSPNNANLQGVSKNAQEKVTEVDDFPPLAPDFTKFRNQNR